MKAAKDYSKAAWEGANALLNFDRARENFQRDPTQAAAVETAREQAVLALGRLQNMIIALAADTLSGEPNVVPFARAR